MKGFKEEERRKLRMMRGREEGRRRGRRRGEAVVVNAGHCTLAGSQAAKPWQLVSLCVTDLIDHKPDSPHTSPLACLSPSLPPHLPPALSHS